MRIEEVNGKMEPVPCVVCKTPHTAKPGNYLPGPICRECRAEIRLLEQLTAEEACNEAL